MSKISGENIESDHYLSISDLHIRKDIIIRINTRKWGESNFNRTQNSLFSIAPFFFDAKDLGLEIIFDYQKAGVSFYERLNDDLIFKEIGYKAFDRKIEAVAKNLDVLQVCINYKASCGEVSYWSLTCVEGKYRATGTETYVEC